MCHRTATLTSAVVVFVALVAAPASADTHVVLANGSGDFPNVQAAIDAATGGDIIELGDGTFDGVGNRDIDFSGKAITIRSQSDDPSACVFELGATQSVPYRGFIFQSGEGASSVLRGVTVSNGYVYITSGEEEGGGGILCDSSSPTIENCIIGSNTTDGTVPTYGGGILCRGISHPTITGCYFVNNEASMSNAGCGGALACLSGAGATIYATTLNANYAGDAGGGAYCDGADVTFDDCTINDNGAADAAGVYMEEGTYNLTGCTLLWNEATGTGVGGAILAATGAYTISGCTIMGNLAASEGGGIFFSSQASGQLTNSIVAYSLMGGGIYLDSPDRPLPLAVSCCDVFENTGGDYVGGMPDQTGMNDNISLEPKFCDAPAGDVTIYDTSPCAPANSPCGFQIGAEGVDCLDSPVEEKSWGGIKSTYE